MTLHCKLCHHVMHSVKPDLEAQSELMQAMMEHLGRQHPKDAKMLAEDMATLESLLATYLLIKHYIRIPAEEKTFRQTFADNEQALLNLFDVSGVTS